MFDAKKELQAQVAQLEAEKAELQADLDTEQQINRTNAATLQLQQVTAESNRDTIDSLQREVTDNKVASDIGNYALAELRKVQASGEIMISAADVARDVVAKRLKDQATAEQTNQLIAAEEEEQRKNFSLDVIKQIRADLDETFKADGTYTRLGNAMEDVVRRDARAELIQAETERLNAHYADPEVQVALRDQQSAKLEADGTLNQLRADLQAQAEAEWAEAAKHEVETTERANLEAQSEVKIRELGEAWQRSAVGQAYIAGLVETFETNWEKQGREAVAERLGDTVFLEVLKRLNEKNKAKLEREQKEKLDLKEFSKGGIDMLELPADTILSIYCGVKTQAVGTCIKTSESYMYEKGRRYNVNGNQCYRILKLAAVGNGEFVVNSDQFFGHSQKSRNAGSLIKQGTIVRFGTYMKDGQEIKRSARLVKGLPFLFLSGDMEVSSIYEPMALDINNKSAGGATIFVPDE